MILKFPFTMLKDNIAEMTPRISHNFYLFIYFYFLLLIQMDKDTSNLFV